MPSVDNALIYSFVCTQNVGNSYFWSNQKFLYWKGFRILPKSSIVPFTQLKLHVKFMSLGLTLNLLFKFQWFHCWMEQSMWNTCFQYLIVCGYCGWHIFHFRYSVIKWNLGWRTCVVLYAMTECNSKDKISNQLYQEECFEWFWIISH